MPQELKDGNLLQLFEAISVKIQQMQQAIRVGNDQLVRLLDRELDPLIAAAGDHQAEDLSEVLQQLRFVNSLIREDADDRSCVLRHTAMLSVLLDRYFGGDRSSTTMDQSVLGPPVATAGDDSFLNETILNSLPDRVAVVTFDYRYLYSNPANARYYQRQPFDLVGRHVAEFLGRELFEISARGYFDRCFRGESVEYAYWQDCSGRNIKVRCRMTPLIGFEGRIIGAVVILKDQVMPAAVVAA